jgi:DNA-binding CsgD family transcriptional regulator
MGGPGSGRKPGEGGKCFETLQLYAAGKTVNQIARSLSIHPNAVLARMRYARERKLMI